MSLHTDYDTESDNLQEALYPNHASPARRSSWLAPKPLVISAALFGTILLGLAIFNTTITLATLQTARTQLDSYTKNWADGVATATPPPLAMEVLRAQAIVTEEHRNEQVLGHVYVINLSKRTDRRDVITNMMRFLRIPVDFLMASTPATIEFKPPSAVEHKVGDGQVACWRSHMNVYQDVVAKGRPRALILEDDVDVEVELAHLVEQALTHLPENWDMYYLGHCSSGDHIGTMYDVEHGIRKLKGPWCTHAYMVSQKGARKLLSLLSKPTAAIDSMISQLGWDDKISAFSADPLQASQIRRKDDPSDIPSSGHSQLWEGLRNSTRKALDNAILTDNVSLNY
ncbi:glycosyltransferase family 25-domain-containing protein [Dimargaris cristalligena]|uniref:Glycosyltransferase family 25-domain-containing protein n=1 Tax=Dimargaris cristalligena TaxID=215637 RepID=A0A4P9ZV33_9FUNG|nr:glycosyltransferase family 25-domain-containing protein [Dimargaris cristalligena]|eukprot:RKP37444.1 glycosyltransferase family 25-domain-containing protein [Dimargaris cristalligena]